MTRSEHMRWCKQRALEILDDGDVQEAFASMASDLRKHPETDNPALTMLMGTVGLQYALDGDAVQMRRFIEGFAE